MKLLGKLIINGHIEIITGLSIGGSNTDVVIGGIDNNVIKNSEGIPYIPGSSLKGKMRSLLEKKEGKEKPCDCGDCDICAVFGVGVGSKNLNKVGPTRIYVRDANLNKETKDMMENSEGIFKNLELEYTEGKWENTINRKTSKASNPRQIERVPPGAIFDLNIIYNFYDSKEDFEERFASIIQALNLIEDDYLGGSGSRGYGRVKFRDLKFSLKSIKDYEENNKAKVIYEGNLEELNNDNIGNIFKKCLSEVGLGVE